LNLKLQHSGFFLLVTNALLCHVLGFYHLRFGTVSQRISRFQNLDVQNSKTQNQKINGFVCCLDFKDEYEGKSQICQGQGGIKHQKLASLAF